MNMGSVVRLSITYLLGIAVGVCIGFGNPILISAVTAVGTLAMAVISYLNSEACDKW